jgi:uncharacterized protein YndB with AHSA1/START domain
LTSSPGERLTVRRQRTLAPPPAVVYRAWLDPEIVHRWLVPGDLELARLEVDERVGGRYRVWQTQGGRARGGFEAEILELVPNERIVFRWGFVGPKRDAGPVYDSLLTITLSEAPEGGTRLVLVHERLDDLAAAMPEVADQVGNGWDDVLDKLGVAVGA